MQQILKQIVGDFLTENPKSVVSVEIENNNTGHNDQIIRNIFLGLKT